LKSWPPDRWAAVAKLINNRWGVRPIITGSPAERPLIATIVERSDGAAIDFAGQIDLGALAALYRAANLVIAMDSGPLHLASAVGTPVVGIYGPAGEDEFGPVAPAGRIQTVHADLPCRPCRTMIDPPCGARTEPACLLAITPGQVVAAASAMLNWS
jgi:ADP-heptose:LPS heptosyltransferase